MARIKACAECKLPVAECVCDDEPASPAPQTPAGTDEAGEAA